MPIVRSLAGLIAAGLFAWILVLFMSTGVSNAYITVDGYDAQNQRNTDFRDIECSSLADTANGESDDWPLDDNGEREGSSSLANDAPISATCQELRSAVVAKIALIAVPTIVLGAFGLIGTRRDPYIPTNTPAADDPSIPEGSL